jgi:hypothetical protein
MVALCPAGRWGAQLLAADTPARNFARRAGSKLLPVLRRLIATTGGRRLAFSRFMTHPERLSAVQAQRTRDAFVNAPGYEAVNAGMRRRRAGARQEVDVAVTIAWGEHDRVVRRSPRVHRRHG